VKLKRCDHSERPEQQYSKAKMEHRWKCKRCGKWFLGIYKIEGVYEIDENDKFKIRRRLWAAKL
jgi:hypothetical protein